MEQNENLEKKLKKPKKPKPTDGIVSNSDDKKIKRGRWTEEENEILVGEYNNQKILHMESGKSSSRGAINWTEIQKKIKTRSIDQMRSHYHALVSTDDVSVIERRILSKCCLSEKWIQIIDQVDSLM
jgi:hypothetical protein